MPTLLILTLSSFCEKQSLPSSRPDALSHEATSALHVAFSSRLLARLRGATQRLVARQIFYPPTIPIPTPTTASLSRRTSHAYHVHAPQLRQPTTSKTVFLLRFARSRLPLPPHARSKPAISDVARASLRTYHPPIPRGYPRESYSAYGTQVSTFTQSRQRARV